MRLFSMACLIILFSVIFDNQSADAAAAQESIADSAGMYTAFNDGSGVGADHAIPPEQMLQRASQLGQNGKIQQALEVAAAGYKRAQHDPSFVIRYVDLLNELATAEGEADKKILNVAIRAANSLNKSKICNGQSDAEMSYHFMVSLGSLADNVVTLNERIAAQLYASQGKIARNLRNNPGYPSESLSVLGQPLVNLAKSRAIKSNPSAAVAALTEAFEIGFTDFDSVLEDSIFDTVDQESLAQVIEKHQAAYRTKVKQWSVNEIANFQPFKVRYDVASVDGGRVSSDNSLGKITVVDLWATWCPPCRQGIPHFIKLQKELDRQGVVVVGISMDDPENPVGAVDAVKSFGIDNGINYELGMGTEAIKQQIPGQLKWPTTLFIDQTGTVRYLAQGYHDYEQLAAITEVLAAEVVSTPSDQTAPLPSH
jgi:thiol-disulfide isomerase/thioredoxin